MKRLKLPILSIILASCILLGGGVLAGLAAEHGVHHSHHNAATHSTAVCAWMCAAGQVLQGFDFGLYGPSLSLLLDEPAIPSTPDSQFTQASRSRAPPSA